MIQTLNSPTQTKNHIPEYIDNHHWEEWKRSGVDDAIIKLNVKSIHDSYEIDKILNRNNKSRWKHSDDLVPAWCVTGINPITGERNLEGVQVKPDNPPSDKDGKTRKYFSASGHTLSPLFLDTGNEGYWTKIIEDKSIPVHLGEGAKKAAAGLTIDLATISLPGVSTCRKLGRLHPNLELVAGFGRVIYFAFDNDVLTKRPVQNALLGMARELSATGSKIMVIQIPEGQAKGMDDYIVANGEEAFKTLIAEAKTIEEWREEVRENWQQSLDAIKSTKRSKLARHMEVVRLGWGHDLRHNDLKSVVELAESPLDLNQVRLKIALDFDLDIPIQDATTIVETIAFENRFHPVEDYLDGLAQQYPSPDLTILDNLATRYFGTDDTLHNIYLKKTLVAAIARIKKPGCKHDTSTILVGKQGVGKSTFWRHLFMDEWFSDELGDANEKDELMKLHRFWCLEWSEFETVYKRKDVASLKKFMSSTTDAFRTPYSRNVKEYPRRCVLVGTTNESEILSDPTGSRRFWIIPVFKYIPVEQLEAERDRIWAAAYALYQSGEKWWLNAEQSAMQEEKNKEFQTQDPWLEIIQDYIQHKDCVFTAEIFTHLSIEPARQDIGLRKRITAILKHLGCESIRKYIGGKWSWIWKQIKINVGFFDGSTGSSGSRGSSPRQSDVCNKPQENAYLDPDDPVDPSENSTFIFSEESTEIEKCDRIEDDVLQKTNPVPTKVEVGKVYQCDRIEEDVLQKTNPVPTKVEVGTVCLSWSLNKKVKVNKLYLSAKKADVFVAGDAIAKPRLSLNDLYPLPEENWQPKMNQLAMYGSDLVKVVGFESNGRKYQVEFLSGRLESAIRPQKLSKPC